MSEILDRVGGELPLEVAAELRRLRADNARLLRLLELTAKGAAPPGPAQAGFFEAPPGPVHANSEAEEKVAFFGALFAARTDVYAVRYDNRRTGKTGWVPAMRGGFRKGVPRSERDYLPLTAEVLAAHLPGRCTSASTRCWTTIRAGGWQQRMGTGLLREAMALRGRMKLASYDRLFPSQDLLPVGGVGNLIAAPLFRPACDDGRTVFVDPGTLEPHRDQWAYFSSLGRMSPRKGERAAGQAGRVPVGSEVTRLAPAASTATRPVPAPVIHARFGAGIRLEQAELTPGLAATPSGRHAGDAGPMVGGSPRTSRGVRARASTCRDARHGRSHAGWAGRGARVSQARISKIEHGEISGIDVVRAYVAALGGSIDVGAIGISCD